LNSRSSNSRERSSQRAPLDLSVNANLSSPLPVCASSLTTAFRRPAENGTASDAADGRPEGQPVQKLPQNFNAINNLNYLTRWLILAQTLRIFDRTRLCDRYLTF
jgi:hypothetical protein